MEKTVIVKIILSFIIAGTWISLATLYAEKLGSKLGGLISNLPSNILISMVFIALIHGEEHIPLVVPGVPYGMLIDTFFLLLFVWLLKYSAFWATVLSLGFWFLCALGFNALQLELSLWQSSLGYFVITLFCFLLAEKTMKIPSHGNNSKTYKPKQILVRAAFAGGIVATVVLISNFANPYWVGVLSAFPAVILSTMLIFLFNQGVGFARATGKILIISSTNIVVYSIAIAYFYPLLGILLGTLISFLLSVLWVWLIVPFLKRIH